MHHLDRLEIELMKLVELKNRGLYERYKEDIEFDFINLFFLNTIRILIKRFDEIPEGLIKEMQKITKTIFPCWKENPLLILCKDIYMQCRLIDYPFEKGDKREVILAYTYVTDERNKVY